MINRILFIQECMEEYRIPFFNKLASRLDGELTVITSDNIKNLRADHNFKNELKFNWVPLSFYRIGLNSHKAIVLMGLVKVIIKLHPKIIILSSNYRLIQSWILYFFRILLKYKVLYWGHGYHHQPIKLFMRKIEKQMMKFIGNHCVNGMLVYANDGAQYLNGIGISKDKIFIFNNTLDIVNVRRIYNNLSPDEIDNTLKHFGIKSTNCVVYIGRMIERKEPKIALEYWKEISKYVPDSQLIMIGKGPLLESLRKQANSSVVFTGAIFNEKQIACIMKVTRAIFCPGYAGLNVNHSFAYGKPFVVMDRSDHSPEISYVKDGINGLVLLEHAFYDNINKLVKIMTDEKYHAKISNNALLTGSKLTMGKMVNQVVKAVKSRGV